MEIICESCNTKLNIPDEKIPKDQMVRVNCPKCRYKITIEPQTSDSNNKSSSDPYSETGKMHLKFIESTRSSTSDEEGPGYEDFSDDESLVFFEEDVKLALIMIANEDHAVKVRSVIEELGYKAVEAPTTRDALGKMRFHHFDLIVLADGFDGQELARSPIINYLNHISISSRRRMFLALFSDQFKSMDEMTAFSLSANAIFNPKDLDRLVGIMKKALSDNEKFYKVYMDTLLGVGKG
jgi:predicted Zn finger-like uncharacterized protein